MRHPAAGISGLACLVACLYGKLAMLICEKIQFGL